MVDDHARRGPGKLDRFHLTLLAATPTGYRNLVKLSSAGFLEGFQRGKPSVDLEQIAGTCRRRDRAHRLPPVAVSASTCWTGARPTRRRMPSS